MDRTLAGIVCFYSLQDIIGMADIVRIVRAFEDVGVPLHGFEGWGIHVAGTRELPFDT